MTLHRRAIVGLCVAPLAAALPSVVVTLFSGNPKNWIPLLFFILPFSYVGSFIIGLPALLAVRKLKLSGLFPYLVVGFVSGAACGSLFIGVSWNDGYSLKALAGTASVFGLHGISVAFVFWVIAFMRSDNPYLDKPEYRAAP